MPDCVDVVVVGGGQAGVAMSEHLSTRGIAHVVLERGHIAERWRSERWDSLVTNGPVWHDRFPGLEFPIAPDAFATKDEVVRYFEQYVERFGLPMVEDVEVTAVRRRPGTPGFRVETTRGALDARFVVAATGAFQVPVVPAVVAPRPGLLQLHSSGYKNPGALPEGGVLVVGAGSSGVQIAAELRRSGREVYLSVGPHDRPPRAYRDRDFVWWLGVLGKWDAATPPAGAEHVTIAVSGADGGHTVDFRDLSAEGVRLVGRTEVSEDGTVTFADDLARNIAAGDANYLSLLAEADAYVEAVGLDLPEEPAAHDLGPMPADALDPIRRLDLAGAGITTIVWATGYTNDYSWLEDVATDDRGRPVHQRGVSSVPGAYFLGLPWQSRRGSSFIWGVWHDAAHIADHIAIQRTYSAYRPASDTAPAEQPRPVTSGAR